MKVNLYLLLFLLLITTIQPAYSQTCDPKIKKIAVRNRKLRYRERENRCEGFYASAVSSKFEVVGLIEGNFHYKLDKDEVIKISSPIVSDQPVYVRAVGIPSRTYYRLDARLDPGQTLTWPVADVLHLKNLSAKEIGVFGWIGEETEKTYVPVAAAAQIASVADDEKIRLILRPAIDVKNVQWRSADVVDGACTKFGESHNMRKSSYRKGQPIKIILPESETGELCVEVAAQSQRTTKWEKIFSRVIVGR